VHEVCPVRPPVELDAAQGVHAAEPPAEKESTAQAVQVSAGPVKPFEPYPGAHSLHTEPTFLKPKLQTQAFWIGSKKEKSGQTQPVFVGFAVVPTGQVTHADLPARYVYVSPTPQSLQVSAPMLVPAFPAGQAVHVPVPLSENPSPHLHEVPSKDAAGSEQTHKTPSAEGVDPAGQAIHAAVAPEPVL
jgi:hypothetical protein